MIVKSQTNKELDSILQEYTNNGKLPCALGAVINKDNGLLYVGSSGLKDIENNDSLIDNDATLAFFSCSKSITTTALLQLIEKGLIKSIDDPVENYVKDIKDVYIINGFDDNNKPILTKPKTKPTLRHLLTHTSGFAYSFFNYHYKTLQDTTGIPNILNSTWDDFNTPLTFEPGTKWHYGAGIDWVGKVIYDVTNMSLGDYCKENIFNKLNAPSLTFERSKDQINNTIELHQRNIENPIELKPLRDVLPEKAEFHAGGHGCFGTITDFMKFLEIFLHEGKCPETGFQILKPETIANYSFKNLLPENVFIKSTLDYSDANLSNKIDLEKIPDNLQGWTSSFHKIDCSLPTGRGKSYSWAGLPNLYYWIDIDNGIIGMWATQVFPFMDNDSLECFNKFETAVYQNFL